MLSWIANYTNKSFCDQISYSIDGPGGRVCGKKNGYVSLAKLKPESQQRLRLSVVVQGPAYKWLVKISQISCHKVKVFQLNWKIPSLKY